MVFRFLLQHFLLREVHDFFGNDRGTPLTYVSFCQFSGLLAIFVCRSGRRGRAERRGSGRGLPL